MSRDEVIIRFNSVTFEYGKKLILDEAAFSIRRGSKITLMGQNGAGKSTLFRLITGDLNPESGSIAIANGTTIATARQVIPREEMPLTVKEFFEKQFEKTVYDIVPRIEKILAVVHLAASPEKKLSELSGGQQARILLGAALIREPDILLLDEPTNNLDREGIAHLTEFLVAYSKTCIVISHDAGFLNSFTHGVLYLDVFTRKIEQYTGDYLKVVGEIQARLERERMKNVRLEKDIEHRKAQANFFAQKGGHLRDVARKMNEKIADLSEEIVEVRREDKTIRNFTIPCQSDVSGKIVELGSVSFMRGRKVAHKKVEIILKRKERLLLTGPNGIGKTTLLESLATGHASEEAVASGVTISYYRQDFSTLDFEKTVYQTLSDAAKEETEEQIRSLAAGFLLDAELLKTKVGLLSEGQKGLVSFAKISLERPGLLILDEPTNHINFRHIPVIARALDRFEGAMILVSHVPDFVAKIRIDYTLSLGEV